MRNKLSELFTHNINLRTPVILAFVIFTFLSCEYENAELKFTGRTVKYSTDIAPLVATRCAIAGCHTTGAPIGNFTEYQALKERVNNGKLQLMVFDLKLMPPVGASSLTLNESGNLKLWIEQGALEN